MQSKILQEFRAEINTIIFDDKMTYRTIKDILEKIEEKFGEIYTNEFILELSYAIEEIPINSDQISYSELEWDIINSIEEADEFEDIRFEYFFPLADLNDRISAGKFTK